MVKQPALSAQERVSPQDPPGDGFSLQLLLTKKDIRFPLRVSRLSLHDEQSSKTSKTVRLSTQKVTLQPSGEVKGGK